MMNFKLIISFENTIRKIGLSPEGVLKKTNLVLNLLMGFATLFAIKLQTHY